MKTQTKILATMGLVAAVGAFGLTSVMAADSIGTVTGKDGDTLDKVRINGEVVSVDGSHITFKDSETGETYDTAFGPSWYTKSYEVGEDVVVEGVPTEGENDNNHNFQTMKVNDTELRSEFEGRPSWAGGRNGSGERQGNGQGQMNKGQNSGGNFVDEDGDGNCDNQ